MAKALLQPARKFIMIAATAIATPALAGQDTITIDASTSVTTSAIPTAVIPAGTLVALRIDENLSSSKSKRGDKFPISLMNDLWVGNRVAIPIGTKGVGEVIHAAKKGFGGRAGELILTARYLEHNGRQIRLGHFRLSAAGANNSTAALLATTAAPIIGVFITGTSAYVGVGQLAQAKIIVDFPVVVPQATETQGTAPKGGN